MPLVQSGIVSSKNTEVNEYDAQDNTVRIVFSSVCRGVAYMWYDCIRVVWDAPDVDNKYELDADARKEGRSFAMVLHV